MKVEQRLYKEGEWSSRDVNKDSQLVIVFFSWFYLSPVLMTDFDLYKVLRWFYPNADIVFVSSYSEIYDTSVLSETISIVALNFENTPIKVISWEVSKREDSSKVAQELAQQLNWEDLKHVLMFSDGLSVSARESIFWMKKVFSKDVWVTGWLAWDNLSFQNTYVWLNSFSIEKNNIVMIWLYGNKVKVWGNTPSVKIWDCSLSWWTKFWMKRTITKSEWNILYELDWEPAADVYKRYLWDRSWVFYPIPIGIFSKEDKEEDARIRTLLTMNEVDKSITFAWDVPQWYYAYFMKSNYDDLIEWAKNSAEYALKSNPNPQFALLISCTSRKLVLKQRIEEELEAVSDVVWKDCKMIWFYSYWEIWKKSCKRDNSSYFLHNQTMTVILLSEE